VETGKDDKLLLSRIFSLSNLNNCCIVSWIDLIKVGETFIAVTGLPERQADHAIRMTRFALVCLAKANRAFERLETTLGPDTGDLRLRFGLHSGPVTAGYVLRYCLNMLFLNAKENLTPSCFFHSLRIHTVCYGEKNRGFSFLGIQSIWVRMLWR
jgi:hypothetical protein